MKRYPLVRINLLIYILITVLPITGCNQHSDKTYTEEVKEGVRHIHNLAPLWGDEPKIKLEFVQQYGEYDSEDENYWLDTPMDIARDTDGNIYVLEMMNRSIKKFDSKGVYISTFGRWGQGPGEIDLAIRICIDNNNNIIVADTGNLRFQIYSSEGKNLGSHRMVTPTTALDVLSDGNLITSISPKGPNDIMPNILRKFTVNGTVIQEFGSIYDFGDDEKNAVYQDIRFTVSRDDFIYSAFKFANAIDKYTPEGELLFRADRPMPFKYTDEVKSQEINMPNGRSMVIPFKSPASERVYVDDKDRIWVLTYKKDIINVDRTKISPEEFQEDLCEFHIFNNEGIFLGVLPITDMPVTDNYRLFDDRLFFIDSQTNMVVHEYRIVDK